MAQVEIAIIELLGEDDRLARSDEGRNKSLVQNWSP